MEVPQTQENAILLLAAAHKLGYDASAVPSTATGFTASDEIMQEAGFMEKPEPEKPAAKKTAAKSKSSKE